MLSYIADLKRKEKGRTVFCSSLYCLVSCFLVSLAIFVVSLVFDSIDGIVDLEIYIKFIYSSSVVLLFSALAAYSLRFLTAVKSRVTFNVRFFVFIVRKHLSIFFAMAAVIIILAYVVFMFLAKNQTRATDRNLAEVAQLQIKNLNEWRNHQVLPGHNARGYGFPVSNKRFVPELSSAGTRSVPGHSRNSPLADDWSNPDIQSIGTLFSLTGRYDLVNALKHKRIWMGSLKRMEQNPEGMRDWVTLYVPFLKKTTAGKEAGVRIHYVDPADSLIPMLSVWSNTGKTSKVFLFSRFGEEIVILRNSSTEKVVYPLSLNESSREQWLKKMSEGRSGIFHGLDYAGKRVVGYVEKIPDSDWSLMIKMDEREAYSHIQNMAWYILLIAFLMIIMSGSVIFFILRHRHMQHQTERLKMGLKQKALRQHYDYLSKYANDVIMLMDVNGMIIEANDRSEKMFGKVRTELLGKNIRTVFDLKDDSVFEEKWSELRREESLIFEAYGRHTNGSIFPVEISSRVIETEGRLFIQFIIRDISEKKKADEMIWRHANFDQITGLPNRRMFSERLFFETRKALRTHASVALMFLDLDHFKDVNDTLGHGIGDLLLKEASDRLRLCIRETDTVARLGGDEFTVILTDLDDFKDVERVAQNILRELSEPFTLEGQPVHISASVGITFFPEDAADTHDLMKNADQAMYAAKSMGGNQYHYFTQSVQEAVRQRMNMINDLHVALEKNQFQTVFQPIVNLETGAICRAEALIRWHHPVHGVINPANFVPLAEDTGLIQAFGDWIFLEAARQAAKWRKIIPDFQVSINISPVQFKNEGIDTDVWFAHLKHLDLPPEAIVIEITEGLLLEIDDSITRQLLALRDAGIEVALDDFGTGYSSMAYLKKLDIDYVKIDQMFVKNLTVNEEDRVLCEAMVLMAHKLGIAVIAEGVETQAQLGQLASFGCDYVQGYYISGPLGEQEFDELIETTRKIECCRAG